MYKLAVAHYVWSLLPCDLLNSRKEEDTATLWAGTQSDGFDSTFEFLQISRLFVGIFLGYNIPLSKTSWYIYEYVHGSKHCETCHMWNVTCDRWHGTHVMSFCKTAMIFRSMEWGKKLTRPGWDGKVFLKGLRSKVF